MLNIAMKWCPSVIRDFVSYCLLSKKGGNTVDGQLAAWQTQTLRLTAFPSPSVQIIQPTWWHDLMGEEPENRSLQPRKGGLREEGPFADGNLILGVAPTRIDWFYTPTVDEKQVSEGFLTISPLHDAIGVFAPLMNRWFELETCPTVRRLAFGGVILQPVQDRQTGYQRIMQYLPLAQMDIDNSSDFSYQINRKRNSRVIPDLSINRLSRWSVVAHQDIEMPIPPALTHQPLGPIYHACQLELDINTVPEFPGEFERGQLSSIFQELIDWAVEIAREGDIR
jgi:hypothetical protein